SSYLSPGSTLVETERDVVAMLRSQATRLSGRNLFPRLFGPPAEAGHKNAIFHFDQIWIHSIKNQRMRFTPGLAFIVGLGLVERVGPFRLVSSGPQENDEPPLMLALAQPDEDRFVEPFLTHRV